MINDDDFVPSNKTPINITPINKERLNEQRLNERLAVEASDYLLVNELFRNINDASINDTPIINNRINVIAEKLKRVKRDNIVKDQLGTEWHNNPIRDKRTRFTDNFKKNKLLAIKIGSMIDRIDEVEDDTEYDDSGYYDIEDKLLTKNVR
jgi:hypothetical protein